MKVGDLVRLNESPKTIGIVVSLLNHNGYVDVATSRGAIVFIHNRSLELISEKENR